MEQLASGVCVCVWKDVRGVREVRVEGGAMTL